jgi:hypothetical protein
VVTKWNDVSFTWDPADYGNINVTRMIAADIWTPDIFMGNRYVEAGQLYVFLQQGRVTAKLECSNSMTFSYFF